MSDHPYYNYEASIQKLVEWLILRNKSDWSPTPRVLELKMLAQRLEETADLIGEQRWMFVEEAYNTDPPPEIGKDGWPIERDPEESMQGMWEATKWRLRDIAATALQEAALYPDSRAKPEIPWGASAFLHIWYQCGKDRPTIYDKSEAVLAFGKVCVDAGIHLSDSRYRKALGAAWEEFDPLSQPDGLDLVLVYHQ